MYDFTIPIPFKSAGQTNQPPSIMPSVPHTITDERDNKRVKFNISELQRLNHDQVIAIYYSPLLNMLASTMNKKL